jgi:hypothetical protein
MKVSLYKGFYGWEHQGIWRSPPPPSCVHGYWRHWQLDYALLVVPSNWHLLGWNSIFQSDSHFNKLPRSSWSFTMSLLDWIFRYRTQSSAKSLKLEWCKYSDRSFINRRNISGPSTLPWGTPAWTGALHEFFPSTTTRWFLSLRKSLTHWSVDPQTPCIDASRGEPYQMLWRNPKV